MADFLAEGEFELGLKEGFRGRRKEERGCAGHVTAWGGHAAVCMRVCPSLWDKDPEPS